VRHDAQWKTRDVVNYRCPTYPRPTYGRVKEGRRRKPYWNECSHALQPTSDCCFFPCNPEGGADGITVQPLMLLIISRLRIEKTHVIEMDMESGETVLTTPLACVTRISRDYSTKMSHYWSSWFVEPHPF
jgi:hypothetical protein